MPQGPAARQFDPVVHPLPPVLQPGPASFDVIIGFLKAWRGLPLASAGALMAAKTASDITIKVAEAATLAAAGTPGAPAAKLAEETVKAQQAAQMGSMITSMAAGADIHMCVTPLPIPPHGPGVVIDGSPTVMINTLPACRMGDTIIEAIGPPNKIAMGCPTVIIGQMGSGTSTSAGSGTGSVASATSPDTDGEAKYEKAGSQAMSGPTTVKRDAIVPGGGGSASSSHGALAGGAQTGQPFIPASSAPPMTAAAVPPPQPQTPPPSPQADPVQPPEEVCLLEAKASGIPFVQAAAAKLPVVEVPTGSHGPAIPLDKANDFGTHIGAASGRPFFLDEIALPIEKLTIEGVEITPEGIADVVLHLSRFEPDPLNAAMLDRLAKIAAGEMPATDADKYFYTHERRELERYRALGWPEGEPADRNEAYRLWNNAHTATLEDFGITNEELFPRELRP